MTKAVLLRELGGPEMLTIEEVPPTEIQPDEIRIEQKAVGVNYIDTYFRRGIYATELPAVVGDQAVGVVTECGKKVKNFEPGNVVAYASVFGSYCETRCIPADRAVGVPDGITPEIIASSLTRGLTVEYLIFRLHQLRPEETIVVHAAAGALGMLLCQWAKAIGATVIGTVGSEAKIKVATKQGCDLVVMHSDPELVSKVQDFTAGKMVDVVYDSIGKDTFDRSLELLKPRGLMVAYGNASGKPEPFDVLTLARLGSLFLTRPILSHYVGTHADLSLSASRYFAALLDKTLKPAAISKFALSNAGAAHRHLEKRAELSVPLLIP